MRYATFPSGGQAVSSVPGFAARGDVGPSPSGTGVRDEANVASSFAQATVGGCTVGPAKRR